MTVSSQTLVPEISISGTGAYDQPADYWPWAQPTTTTPTPAGPAPVLPPAVIAQVLDRTTTDDYPDWLGHVRAASGCRHPIRLDGAIHVNNPDGQRIHTVSTDDMPDGAIYVPCGNRRAAICPSCAEVYRRDTYHLIKAGLQGDRWGIPPLHEHIALFVTATAPSFGTVHHRVVKVHAADCRRKQGCTCRPQVCQAFGRTCPHGRPLACRERHTATNARLGQPLCVDCYDHNAHVVWHHEAPELWRRTIQEVDREIQRLGRRLGVELRRRYFKVFEFQYRGAIHYHAIIRLDGHNPDCPQAIVPPPRVVSRDMFKAAVTAGFVKTSFVSAPHPANGDSGWDIRWGRQLDVRHINAPGSEITYEHVTGYIAKYVTKDTETTGLALRRVDELVLEHLDPDEHTTRLIRACWDLGAHEDFARLRKYAHRYGYGGHIATKSRGFSVTRGFLQQVRTIWRRTEGHPHTWDDEQADLVVYELGYQATGWRTTGDALLANTAAALAREYANTARLEAHNLPAAAPDQPVAA